MGSLWYTGSILFHSCLEVATIFEFEMIEIACPKNDWIALHEKEAGVWGSPPSVNKQNVKL